MDHVKDALEYVAGLAVGAEKPEQVTINGRTYCTKSLVRYDRPDMAEPIKATTLASLVDYIKESREELRERIRSVFQDSGVDVWDCEIVF